MQELAVSAPTGETVSYTHLNWSPDCRYLTGSVGEMRHGYQFTDYARVEWNYHSTIIWDVLNSGRMNSMQDAGRYSDYVHESPVIWSPNSAYALILSGCPTAFYGCLLYTSRCV